MSRGKLFRIFFLKPKCFEPIKVWCKASHNWQRTSVLPAELSVAFTTKPYTTNMCEVNGRNVREIMEQKLFRRRLHDAQNYYDSERTMRKTMCLFVSGKFDFAASSCSRDKRKILKIITDEEATQMIYRSCLRKINFSDFLSLLRA